MIIAETITEIRAAIKAARRETKSIGLVPTMGALHAGHLALIKRCRRECDFAVVSVFVNPTQFGSGEDLDRYPRTFDADAGACGELGVDLIFAPTAKEMYCHESDLTWVNVEVLTEQLCGASRPLHFRGVCTVVTKLFNIVQPDIAYFGEKDAQQLAVIQRMVAELNMPIEIKGCPIVRDDDGLALSSRNANLAPGQRRQALCLSRALKLAADMVAGGQGDVKIIVGEMGKIVEQEPQAQIDYISIVDKELLQPVEKIDRPVLIALAVKIADTRLIDNITVDRCGKEM